MKTVGVGLIGCGGMAIALGKLMFTGNHGLCIRGLYDPRPESIRTALETFNCDAVVHTGVEPLVCDPSIDWVMIASWNCFHREQAVAAMRAGKHVFCQKPLATTMSDCLAMRRAWERSGVNFAIGFTLRYSPHYRKIKELLDKKTIGSIVGMEFNETLDFDHGGYIMGDWRRLTGNAGTHLLEKCCHDIDLVNWMTGSLAARVASFGGLDFFRPENRCHQKRLGHNKGGRKAYQGWGGLIDLNPFTSDKDIVDNQVAIIEYANGVRATFHTNCNAGLPERRMYILGTEGAIRADERAKRIEVRRTGYGTKSRFFDTKAGGGHGGGDPVLARELSRCMLRGTKPAAGIDDGLTSSITCFAIDHAMRTGRIVDLKPYWKRAAIEA